jgi:membrane fusion protein (multidrug efflux system)
MKTQQLIITAVLFPLLLVAGCHGGGGDDPQEAAAAREAALAPREVTLVIPEVEDETESLQLVGEVRVFDTVKVSPEVAGAIDSVKVEVGDRVRTGQPLAEVDRSTFKIYLQQAEANLAAARADLDLAEKALDRKKDLLSDETIAQATFDQAKAAHDLAAARVLGAEAARDLAQRNWEKSVVRAPAAGSITKRWVVAGQWSDVGQALFELAVGETVKVVARVPASWAPRLSGLEGFVFRVGASTTAYRAKLYSVDPVVNESSRSFEVVGVAKNTDGLLRPGMFANIDLAAPETTRSMWLPVSAIATSDTPKVMIVENDTITVHRIQVGRRVNGRIEILNGIEPGQLVVENVAGLNRGAPVRVVDNQPNS